MRPRRCRTKVSHPKLLYSETHFSTNLPSSLLLGISVYGSKFVAEGCGWLFVVGRPISYSFFNSVLTRSAMSFFSEADNWR